jgi:hypothetical protein
MMVKQEPANRIQGSNVDFFCQIYLQINIQIRVILAVESNESLLSSAESDQPITIVPPLAHNSS